MTTSTSSQRSYRANMLFLGAALHRPEPCHNDCSYKRSIVLDVLRGISLLGILAVNIRGHLFVADGSSDWLARHAIVTMAESKFYPLFSALFGIGLGLQFCLNHTHSNHQLRIIARRLISLYLIGVLFYIFVDTNYILLTYAIVGWVVLLATQIRQRAVMALAVIALIAGMLYDGAAASIAAVPPNEQLNGPVRFDNVTAQVESQIVNSERTYSEWVALRARRYVNLTIVTPAAVLLQVLGISLIGFFIARSGVASDFWFQRHDKQLRGVVPLLLTGWLVGNSVMALVIGMLPERQTPLVVSLITGINSLVLAAAYALAVIVGVNQFRTKWFVEAVASTGRLALSNFVIQYLVMLFLFHSYGLGLEGQLSTSVGLGVVFLTWLLQVFGSVLYLNWFRIGPLEALWRIGTYGVKKPARPTFALGES